MMKTIMPTAVLLLTASGIFAQDSLIIKNLFDSGYLLSANNLQQASKLYNKAYYLSEKAGYQKGFLYYYHHQGIILSKQRQFFSADSLFNLYLQKALLQNNLSHQAKAYMELANNFSRWGKPEQEVTYLQKAMLLLEKQKDSTNLIKVYGNIATVYSGQKMFGQAFRYAFMGLHINSLRGNEEAIAGDYLTLAGVHNYAGNSDSSAYYNRLALNLAKKIGNDEYLAYSLVNLADA